MGGMGSGVGSQGLLRKALIRRIRSLPAVIGTRAQFLRNLRSSLVREDCFLKVQDRIVLRLLSDCGLRFVVLKIR